MIRIKKSEREPRGRRPEGLYEARLAQLLADQMGKCYMCERELRTDYEVEHFRSRRDYPRLGDKWENLYLSCGYCNRKKGYKNWKLLNPVRHNVELLISQRINFTSGRAEFAAVREGAGERVRNTIELLDWLYNDREKENSLTEERFYQYTRERVWAFKRLCDEWLATGSETKRREINEALGIDSELLGFKYWIIRDDERLYKTFSQAMRWNRVAR